MSSTKSVSVQTLNSEQRIACECLNNIILTACPGSGKTRTVSHRLAYLQGVYSTSRRLHLAITYTNRAADEILERIETLNIDADNIWAGTIHQFCMQFIIRPYAMYSDRLHKGYRIIDEYVQREYMREEADNLGIRCDEWDYDKYPSIKRAYKQRLLRNKEIDFEDILDVSVKILQECPYVAENIAATIATIQVDEYQDTNERQYNILRMICDKRPQILISFIGDVNQAIYSSLGGVAKSAEEIRALFNLSFQELHLTGCYRSCQKIIDYYCNYAVEETEIFSLKSVTDGTGKVSLEKYVHKDNLPAFIADIIKQNLAQGIPESEICVVAPRWELILPMANNLRKELPNVRFDAPDITPFKYDPMNPFYLLAKLMFTRPGRNETVRKCYANEVIGILKNDYGINIRNNYDCYHLLEAVNSIQGLLGENGVEIYKKVVQKVFLSMRIQVQNETSLEEAYLQFLEKAKDRIQRYGLPSECKDFFKCFEEKNGVVVNTVHGVKGEEYETVIAFGMLNGYLPHWNDIFSPDHSREITAHKLLYVLCSRAKENLYLIGEKGRKTQRGFAYSLTDEIANVSWDYD